MPWENRPSMAINTGCTAFKPSRINSPSASLALPICTSNCLSGPVPALAAASAEPLNSFFSSFRIIVCAAATSHVSTSDLIIFFWSSENDTPALASAVIPFTGSFSALPTWMVAPLRSVSPSPASLDCEPSISNFIWMLPCLSFPLSDFERGG